MLVGSYFCKIKSSTQTDVPKFNWLTDSKKFLYVSHIV